MNHHIGGCEMIQTPKVRNSEAQNIESLAKPVDCIKYLRSRISKLKEEICAIQGIVDSDDLQLCLDVLTGKRILILREDAQKRFEALFYYVQSLRAINEIELVIDGMEKRIPELDNKK
jgi:hypothetical protein